MGIHWDPLDGESRRAKRAQGDQEIPPGGRKRAPEGPGEPRMIQEGAGEARKTKDGPGEPTNEPPKQVFMNLQTASYEPPKQVL